MSNLRYRAIRVLQWVLRYSWIGVCILAMVLALASMSGCATGELRSVRGTEVFTLPQHLDLCAREPEAAVCPKQ